MKNLHLSVLFSLYQTNCINFSYCVLPCRPPQEEVLSLNKTSGYFCFVFLLILMFQLSHYSFSLNFSPALHLSNVLQIYFLPLWYQSFVLYLRFILLDFILGFLLALGWSTMQPISLDNWPCASLWLHVQWLQHCLITTLWDVMLRESLNCSVLPHHHPVHQNVVPLNTVSYWRMRIQV